jgi:hypothetical protein
MRHHGLTTEEARSVGLEHTRLARMEAPAEAAPKP